MILKVKVHDIIKNYLYINNNAGKTDMNWDCSSKVGCIAILVLNINQVIKKSDNKLFQSFIAKLVFNHRLVFIYELMKKHDSKNAF